MNTVHDSPVANGDVFDFVSPPPPGFHLLWEAFADVAARLDTGPHLYTALRTIPTMTSV